MKDIRGITIKKDYYELIQGWFNCNTYDKFFCPMYTSNKVLTYKGYIDGLYQLKKDISENFKQKLIAIVKGYDNKKEELFYIYADIIQGGFNIKYNKEEPSTFLYITVQSEEIAKLLVKDYKIELKCLIYLEERNRHDYFLYKNTHLN